MCCRLVIALVIDDYISVTVGDCPPVLVGHVLLAWPAVATELTPHPLIPRALLSYKAGALLSCKALTWRDRKPHACWGVWGGAAVVESGLAVPLKPKPSAHATQQLHLRCMLSIPNTKLENSKLVAC